jgi:galactokinase/mevalonate kinase-like predicted kinase
MGDIAEGFVADAVAVAVGTAEEEGALGLTVVGACGGGYMYVAVSGWHMGNI